MQSPTKEQKVLPPLNRNSTEPLLVLDEDRIPPAQLKLTNFRSCREIKKEEAPDYYSPSADLQFQYPINANADFGHHMTRSTVKLLSEEEALHIPADTSQDNSEPNLMVHQQAPHETNQVNSQSFTQPTRAIYMDRRENSNQNNNSSRQLPQLTMFKQESYKGSKMTRIPSSQEIAGNQLPNTLEVPDRNIEESRLFQIGSINEVAENTDSNNEQNMSSQENRRSDIVINLEPDQQGQENQGITSHRQNPNTTQTNEELIVKMLAWKRVVMQFLFNLAVFIANVLAFLYVKDDISVSCLFVFFVIVTLAYIPLSLLYKKPLRPQDFPELALSIGNAISLIIFIAVCFAKTQGSDIPVTPFTLFGIVITLGACCKVGSDPPSLSAMLILIEKTIVWIQLFLIGLKVDGTDFPWSSVFIPLYFALILLAFSSILIIFGSCFAFFGIMREEGSSSKLIIGFLWYLQIAFYTPAWLALLTQVIKYLSNVDDNDASSDEKEDYLKAPLIAGMIQSGILGVYTLIFWKQLCTFQEFEVEGEMIAAPLPPNTIESHTPTQGGQVTFQVDKDNKTRLMMISPTFYSYFSKHVHNKKDKEKEIEIENLKSEVERAKVEQYRKNLMLNVPHRSDLPPAKGDNFVNSPAVVNPKKKALDFSANDVDIERQLPAPTLMKGESKQTLGGENQCTICFDNVPNAVLMDCGHGGICYECALENWKKTDNCILCRQPITKILKIVHIKPLNIVKVVESTRKVNEVENAS